MRRVNTAAHPAARAAVLRQALSVGVATGAYGISFGALAVSSGLAVWQACALSALMFTGGSQFAFIGVIGAGGAPVAAIATAAGLGVRNGFYALALQAWLPTPWPRKALAAQVTIDESTAVGIAAQSGEPALGALGFWATGAAVYALWNLTTLIGALAGDVLGDPRRYGLDAAAAAAFLALLWPRLGAGPGAGRARLVAAGGAFVALIATPLSPTGTPVLLAGSVAVIAGWFAPKAPRGRTDPEPGPEPEPEGGVG